MKSLFIFISIIIAFAFSFRGYKEYKDSQFREHWSEYQRLGATGDQLNKVRSYYLTNGNLLYLDINK